MKEDELVSLIKNEVVRIINNLNLKIDDEGIIDDYVYLSYVNINKYWCNKGEEINKRVISTFVQRAMFRNANENNLLKTVENASFTQASIG
jgi:hypothetical protein